MAEASLTMSKGWPSISPGLFWRSSPVLFYGRFGVVTTAIVPRHRGCAYHEGVAQSKLVLLPFLTRLEDRPIAGSEAARRTETARYVRGARRPRAAPRRTSASLKKALLDLASKQPRRRSQHLRLIKEPGKTGTFIETIQLRRLVTHGRVLSP